VELWSAPCCDKMAGNVIVRQDVLCLHQRMHQAARWPAQRLHRQPGSARGPGRHSASDKQCRSRAGACTRQGIALCCVRTCCMLAVPRRLRFCSITGSTVPVGLWRLGPLARCRVAGRGRCEAVQHAAAAVSAPAPPAERAVSGADAVLPLYKRLQNGSDIRGVAVEGARWRRRRSALLAGLARRRVLGRARARRSELRPCEPLTGPRTGCVTARSSVPPSWAGVLEAALDGTSTLVLSWRKGRKQPAVAGVPDEKRNLTATAAFFIGSGLAEQLAARFNVPTTSLRVSVRSCRAPDLTCIVLVATHCTKKTHSMSQVMPAVYAR